MVFGTKELVEEADQVTFVLLMVLIALLANRTENMTNTIIEVIPPDAVL